MGTVSVIIPAWEADEFLNRALLSITRQTTLPDEIIVGIDGCRKTLRALKRDLNSKFLLSRMKVFWFYENVGSYIVRNTMATESTGDFLLFFDADDEMLSNYVESMVEVAKKDKFARANQLIKKYGEWLPREQYPCTCGCGIKRKLFFEMNGYEGWRVGADIEFMRRSEHLGVSAKMVGEPNMIRYIHGDNLTERDDTGYGSDLRKRIKAEINHRGSDPLQLEQLATTDTYREVVL